MTTFRLGVMVSTGVDGVRDSDEADEELLGGRSPVPMGNRPDGAAGLGYGYAGYLLSSSDRKSQQLGYDIASASSLALIGATAPTVMNQGVFFDVFQTAFAALGAVSTVGNVNKR